MVATGRQYDLVLYGATGYTGKYTAEYIAKSLPTSLKWAIAGRSASKLSTLAVELKTLNPDRLAPGIETSTLELDELKVLARSTSVLINAVGPYGYYGRPVVQACAEEGTGYVDTTGEVPWVKEMIDAFQRDAERSGAVMVPECGFESAIPDLLAYAVVAHIREKYGSGTGRVDSVMWGLKSQPSGGTLATVMSLFSNYSLKAVAESMVPYALSPIPGPNHQKPGLVSRFLKGVFGVQDVPNLGLATTALTGSTDTAIIHRSWGLRPDFYGRKFEYEERAAVASRLRGVLVHWGLALGGLIIIFPPARWLIKKFIMGPGDGPSRESTLKDFAEFRAVSAPEGKEDTVVKGRLVWRGSMYDLSGTLMVEAARGILRGDEQIKGGGFISPATLGDRFLEGMRSAGLVVEIEG